MTDEASRKIEERIESEYFETLEEDFAFQMGAEFGYNLAMEEMNKTLAKQEWAPCNSAPSVMGKRE